MPIINGCGKLQLGCSYSIQIGNITHSGGVFVKAEDTSKTKSAGKGTSGYTSHLSYCTLLYSGYNWLSECSTGQKNF